MKNYIDVGIDIGAAEQAAVDKLMPEQARKRILEERQRRLAAALDNDATFRAVDLSGVSRDSVLPAAQIAAITLGINRSHRCAQLAWARTFGEFATGDVATLLADLVTRSVRLAQEFDVQATDTIAVDRALDFAERRQWAVPAKLGASDDQAMRKQQKAISVSAQRDAAVLSEIVAAGHEPLALPEGGNGKTGKAGVRAEIKKRLGNKGMWATSTAFKATWQRLLSDQKISYSSG